MRHNPDIIINTVTRTLSVHSDWKLNQTVYNHILQDLPAYYDLEELPDEPLNNVQLVINASTGDAEIIVTSLEIDITCQDSPDFLTALEHVKSISLHYGEEQRAGERTPVVVCRFIYDRLFLI